MQWRGMADSTEDVEEAIRKCDEHVAELVLEEARGELRRGAGDKAAVLLLEWLERSPVIPPALHAQAFSLLVQAAKCCGDRTASRRLLAAAGALNGQGDSESFLQGLDWLLEAKAELQAGRYDLAVRYCNAVLEASGLDGELRECAHCLRSLGYRGLDDGVRELEALAAWESCYSHLPNGPADAACMSEIAKGEAGIWGRAKWSEILQVYSRFARLCEQMPDQMAKAVSIYTKIENAGYPNWQDPEDRQWGTIRERRSRLAEDTVESGPLTLALIEPRRRFGVATDEEIAEVLAGLSALPSGAWGGVLAGPLKMQEVSFAYEVSRGRPEDQLVEVHGELKRDGAADALPFAFQEVWVRHRGTTVKRLLLAHDEKAADIQPLAFLLDIAAGGSRFDLSVSVLFLCDSRNAGALAQQLQAVLSAGVEKLTGFAGLTHRAEDFIRRCAHRVAQRLPEQSPEGSQ